MKPHHGFLAGVVGGLALDAHSLVLFGAGVVVGAGAVLLAGVARDLLRWVQGRIWRTDA